METPQNLQRQERITELRRQALRNTTIPTFLQSVSSIAGRQIMESNILTIQQIDRHQISINGTDFKFNYLNLSFPKIKIKELQERLLDLKKGLDNDNYLTLSKSSDVIVLTTNTLFVLDKFEELLFLDGDTINITDPNYLNGLWLDYYTDYWHLDNKTELTGIFELRIFGFDWIKQILPTT